MKNIVLILILFLFACSNNHNVSFELFNPNTSITPEDVYNLNLPRVLGADIDEYHKRIGDTIIVLSTGDDMVFDQRWFFSIEKNIDIHQLETFFENKYSVYTLKCDTFDIENKGIDVIAVSKKNKLNFVYSIEYGKDETIPFDKYVLVRYTYPEYDKFIKDGQEVFKKGNNEN
jgi:hypothetical protein